MFIAALSITTIWRKFFSKKIKRRDAVRYKNCYLPNLRSNEALDDNSVYLDSIISQLEDIETYLDIDSKTNILDFGCGQGRLANGLIFKNTNFKNYHGVDTHEESIDWCKKWIARNNENYYFKHLPAKNERYNPVATSLKKLPYTDGYFDLTFLNSVFSHMMDNDVKFYLYELYRVMRHDGVIYLTAFIEDNVASVQENPNGYLGKLSVGALHRVRYERNFFIKMVQDAGFVDVSVKHRGIERTMQSVVIARK